ncbi:MAG: GNAT family N-acetyltransferase [Candidatus Woesearchaeota archaeon]
MNFIIKKAKKDDAILIYNLIKESLKSKKWEFTGIKECKRYYLNYLKKSLKYNSSCVYFIAFEKNNKKNACGFITYSFKKKSRIRHRIELSWGVHPNYFGKGLGTLLLETALENARKKGFKRAEAEIVKNNKSSLKIAKKLGFKIEGKKNKAFISDDNNYLDTYIVGKLLE